MGHEEVTTMADDNAHERNEDPRTSAPPWALTFIPTGIWSPVFMVLAIISVLVGFAAMGTGMYKDDGYPFFVAAAVLLVGAGLAHILCDLKSGS